MPVAVPFAAERLGGPPTVMSDLERSAKMKTHLKKLLIIGGSLAVGGPMLGVAGTVLGMIGAFDSMGQAGAADPEKLSADIGVTLYSTLIGTLIGFIGAGFLIAAFFIWLSNRSRKPQEI
jgi:biopolymer transport protein ExbB/TolQ